MKQFFGKKNVIIAIVALVVVTSLAGGALWVTSDVYLHRDDNKFVRTIAPILPAAKVGSRTISYAQFLDTRDTIRVYMKSDAAKSAGLAKPLTPDVEKNAFDRLVREAIIEEYAQQKNVSVSDQEVRDAFASLTESTSSTIPNVADFLSKSFNWNEEQFRAKVVRSAILEQKDMATFSTSTQDASNLWEAYVNDRLTKPDVKIYLKFTP